MNNYATLPIAECINFNHSVREFCLPAISSCNNTIVNGLFTDCDKQWNCNPNCPNDLPYYWPIPLEGGKIMLQTNFNTPQNPDNTDAWGSYITLKLFDGNNNQVTGDHGTFASQHVVGHDGEFGYQTVEIDFDKVPVNCGYFQICVDGEDPICTHHFKKVKDDCLVCLESIETKDCFNNYYGQSQAGFVGTSNFKYTNKIYLKGHFMPYGNSTSLETGEVTKRLRFYPKIDLLPPYMMDYLQFKILASDQVIINGETWDNLDSSYTPRQFMTMFKPVIEWSQVLCSKSNC